VVHPQTGRKMIENIGSVLAIIGAVFNCKTEYKWKRAGFGIWIISNGLLEIWAVTIQAWFPAVMYLLFVGTATYGFVNHKNQITTEK
jgi:hypothetical protein